MLPAVAISVLYRAHLCMKCSLGISNVPEEISSLSHSVESPALADSLPLSHQGSPFLFVSIIKNEVLIFLSLNLSQEPVKDPRTSTLVELCHILTPS